MYICSKKTLGMSSPALFQMIQLKLQELKYDFSMAMEKHLRVMYGLFIDLEASGYSYSNKQNFMSIVHSQLKVLKVATYEV